MIKVKDGYAKLVGTTASGSASHILLSNGSIKAVSDFAMADGTNATGTWNIDISGNAKSSTLSKYLLTGAGTECDANTLAFSDHLLRWYSSIPSTSSNLPTVTGWLNGLLALPLHSNGVTAQLYFSATKALFYRSMASDNWNQIAYTTSDITGNANTASKLQNKVKIWGLDFDGSNDVKGNLTLGYNQIYIGDGTDNFRIGWGNNNMYVYHNYYGHYFSTKSGEVMSINSSGNVGIGTTNPKYKLDVSGTIHTNSQVVSPYFMAGLGVEGLYMSTAGISWHDDKYNYKASLISFTSNSISLQKDTSCAGTLDVIGTGTFNSQIISNVADGTAPLTVISTTKVANLNTDLLDGYHEYDFFRYRGALYLNRNYDADTLGIGEYAFRSSAYGSVGSGNAHKNALSENSTIQVFKWLQLSTVAWSDSISYRVSWTGESNSSRPSGWSPWIQLARIKDIPTVTNYYWANVKVSSTSNDKTTPTFANTTVNGIVTVNGPQCAITVNSSCKSAYADFIRMLNPNMSSTYHTAHLAFGYALSAYNLGYIGFKFVAKDSKSNMVTIGLHSADHILNVLASGKVGIGTTSPSELLHVNGTGRVDNIHLKSTYINLNRNGSDSSIYDSTKTALEIEATTDLSILRTYNVTTQASIVLHKNGNVGIGTLTPSAKLHSHGLVKITASGRTLTIGSQNADHCHYSTDSPCHWFNKEVRVVGHVYGGTNYDRRLAYADELLPLTTITKSIRVTTSWLNTGISGDDLGTGSFVVQIVSINDNTNGGLHWSETYTGLMTSFSGATNDGHTDEIPLHRAGHAPNSSILYLRTAREYNSGRMRLQIAGNYNMSAAQNITFKFRRII